MTDIHYHVAPCYPLFYLGNRMISKYMCTSVNGCNIILYADDVLLLLTFATVLLHHVNVNFRDWTCIKFL